MEWQKAKNIVILFLIIVNAILFFIIRIDSAKSKLTTEQEAAIFNVLSRENISLYSDIMSIDFSPLRRMTFQEKPLNHEEVLALFYEDFSGLKREELDGRTTYSYSSGNSEIPNQFIDIEGSSFSFDDYSDRETVIDFDLSMEILLKEAKNLTDDFISKMGNFAKGFSLDIAHYKAGDYIFAVYRYKNKGIIVYPNEIRFTVSSSGIIGVEYTYMEPLSHDGDKREISSPDEALLRFMTTNGTYDATMIIINNVDIVYYWNEDDMEEHMVYAVPCYRINYTTEGALKVDFLIDAYSTEVR